MIPEEIIFDKISWVLLLGRENVFLSKPPTVNDILLLTKEAGPPPLSLRICHEEE